MQRIRLLDAKLTEYLDSQHMIEVRKIAKELQQIYQVFLAPGHVARIIKSVMISRAWAETALRSEAKALSEQWRDTINLVEASLGRIQLWNDLKTQEQKLNAWVNSL